MRSIYIGGVYYRGVSQSNVPLSPLETEKKKVIISSLNFIRETDRRSIKIEKTRKKGVGFRKTKEKKKRRGGVSHPRHRTGGPGKGRSGVGEGKT